MQQSCLRLSAILALVGATIVTASITPIQDTPYEQVIADRYLFAPNAAECTDWPTLPDLTVAQVVASPPFYHPSAAVGAWVIGYLDTAAMAQLLWFNVSSGTLTPVIDEFGTSCSAIIVPTIATFSSDFTFFALCEQVDGPEVMIVQCAPEDASDCAISATIEITSVLPAAVFVDTLGTKGQLFLGTEDGLAILDVASQTITYQVNGIKEEITAVAFSAQFNTVFAGSALNLWIYDIDLQAWSFEMVTALIDSPITSLTYDETNSQLWIGQSTGITLFSPISMPDGQTHWLFTRLAGQISDPGSDVGGLPFANITTLASPTLRFGGAGSDGSVWLGSGRGLMRYSSAAENPADRWRVFNSARYMPQRDAWVNVSSLTLLSFSPTATPNTISNTAIAITAKGIAVIRFEQWTLQQKADYLQTTYMSTPGRHSKYGLVADCETPVWGDTTQCKKQPNDNDGLWTSIYLSSQVFKYAVTQDPTVLSTAWSHFESMQFQQTATGVYGYPARSVALKTDNPPEPGDPHWHPSPTEPLWQFKGDTSSDEITGHEFIYPLVASILAQGPEQQQSAILTSVNITNQIIEHNLYLFGEYGNHTRWGVWNPVTINDDPLWQEGRGPNSVQILGWILQGLVTNGGNESYTQMLQYLLSPGVRYDMNLLNAKMLAVCDSNFSDDELNYLAYFTMKHGLNGVIAKLKRGEKIAGVTLETLQNLQSYMSVGLDMAQRYKVREKSSFYNPIYCYASGQVSAPGEVKIVDHVERKRKTHKLVEEVATKSKKNHPTGKIASATTTAATSKSSPTGSKKFPPPNPTTPQFSCADLAADSVWYLRRWPLEQFNWPQFNSDRLDITLNAPAFGCRSGAQSNELLPPDERGIHKWNDGPFDLDDGDGYSEEGVGPFLSGYWMMRALGMIAEP